MEVSESIPAAKLGQFGAILRATGGRYLGAPLPTGDKMYVRYVPGAYVAQCHAWLQCNPIVKPPVGWLRRLSQAFANETQRNASSN